MTRSSRRPDSAARAVTGSTQQQSTAPSSPPRRRDHLVPGTTLGGRYVVGEKIGEGHTTTVYEATDGTLEQALVVKVLHREIASEELVTAFRRAVEVHSKVLCRT